jgi:DNA-binding phage protein
MDNYSSSVAKCLVGIVRVDISCLAFRSDIEARQVDNSVIQNLITVFTESSKGCERDKLDNQIPAVISSRELDRMPENSQLTRDDLQRSLLGGGYPKLNTSNTKIYCLWGKHRLRAAAVFLRHCDPGDYWWAVKLYTFGPGSK